MRRAEIALTKWHEQHRPRRQATGSHTAKARSRGAAVGAWHRATHRLMLQICMLDLCCFSMITYVELEIYQS
jgi:hypothetical protein